MLLLGHKPLLTQLRQELAGPVAGRSYLFTGPQAVGKFQAAIQIAKELVGEEGFEYGENIHYPADVFVVEPTVAEKDGKKKQKGISVETLREAIGFLSRYPSKGKYRICIIREAQSLSREAQNILLKTLEEPPVSALIILVSHEPGGLLATVRSRLQERAFTLVSSEELSVAYPEKWLEQYNIPVFFRNFGRPGILVNAKNNPEDFQRKKKMLSELYTMSRLSTRARLDLAEDLAANVPEAVELLEWWVTGLRMQTQTESKPRKAAKTYIFIESILEVICDLKSTQGNAKLLLEQLFFQIR